MRNLWLSVLLMLVVLPVFGQTNLIVRVEDSLTHQPVIGATVRTPSVIKPLVGAVTDVNGMAQLNRLPTGLKTLTVSAVGYETKEFPIALSASAIPIPGDSTRTDLTAGRAISHPDTLVFLLHSQDASLDEVTVSATRTNSRIEDLPIKVEVLGQEDMDEESAVVPGNVSSILGDISIIHIQRTSAVNGNQAIRMQGLDPKYTQILRDGLPLYEGFSGNIGVLQIPPLDLKQIEVIKGSVSTLYGGGAIGGLINIVSKSPTTTTPYFTALINRSNLKETNGNAYYSQNFGKTGLTFFTGYTNQEAVDVTGDGFTDGPQIRQFNLHPRFFWNPSDKTRLNIGYTLTSEHREGGYLPAFDVSGPPNGYRNINDIQRHTVDFNASQNTSEKNAVTLKGAVSTFHRKNLDYQRLADGRQSSIYLEGNDLLKIGKQQLIFGGNFIVEQFRKSPATADRDSTRLVAYTYQTIGAFVQGDYQLAEKVSLQAGLRFDHHNTFGNFLLPRLSIKIKPSDAFTVRLSVGTGYKAPNLFVNQTPGSLNVSLIPQRLLPIDVNTVKAERSVGTNVDIAYSKTFESGFSVQVDQAFYYTYVNTPVVSAFANTSSALGAYTQLINAPYNLFSVGTDTYVRLEYKDYELYVGYNHTLARRDGPTDNTYLPLAPQDKFSATVAWENEHFRFGIETSYVGTQYLYNNQKVANYWFFAGAAEYHYNDHWRLVLNGENVFNIKQANYETVVLGANPTVQPTFRPVWAPLEGRIINLALKFTL